MTEAEIRALALFFYFALLDDRKAIECAIEALAICQDRKKRNPEIKNSTVVISATSKVWEDINLKFQRGLPNTSVDSGWVIPNTLDLGPWREFQKHATNDELPAVIWSKILNYKIEDISEALGLSSGTIRHRLARAFRKLGAMTHASTSGTLKEREDV